MKKILIVINASDYGGAENEAIQLANLLLEMQCSVEICTRYRLDRKSSIAQYVKSKSLTLSSPIEQYWKTPKGKVVFILTYFKFLLFHFRFPTYRKRSRFGEHISKLFRDTFWAQPGTKYRLKKFSTIIFLGMPEEWFANLYIAAYHLNVPCFYRVSREIKETDQSHPDFDYFLKNIEKLTGFITHGKAAETRILNVYGALKSFPLILPPIHLRQKNGEKKTSKKIQIGMITRLTKGKRVSDALYAMKNLDAVKLRIAGEGEMISELKHVCDSLRISEKVNFEGVISNAEIASFYSQLDAVLICSESESGPLCAIEAISLNIPLISTPVGIVPEILGEEYPCFFPVGDVTRMVERIKYLMDCKDEVAPYIEAGKTKISKKAAKKVLSQVIHEGK